MWKHLLRRNNWCRFHVYLWPLTMLDAIYSNLVGDVSSILKNNSRSFGYSVKWCLRRTHSIFWTYESQHLHLFENSPSHYLPRPIYKPCKELHLLFRPSPTFHCRWGHLKLLKKLKDRFLKEERKYENWNGVGMVKILWGMVNEWFRCL